MLEAVLARARELADEASAGEPARGAGAAAS
jgi:hypothetical protein